MIYLKNIMKNVKSKRTIIKLIDFLKMAASDPLKVPLVPPGTFYGFIYRGQNYIFEGNQQILDLIKKLESRL